MFRLSATDFDEMPEVVTRIQLPRTGSARSARYRRDLAARIIDHGPGVPQAWRQRIFDRFVRATGVGGPGRRRGSGLGLSIVRGLVEAQGGTVSLEPQQAGVGAVFRFTLKRAEEAARPVSG